MAEQKKTKKVVKKEPESEPKVTSTEGKEDKKSKQNSEKAPVEKDQPTHDTKQDISTEEAQKKPVTKKKKPVPGASASSVPEAVEPERKEETVTDAAGKTPNTASQEKPKKKEKADVEKDGKKDKIDLLTEEPKKKTSLIKKSEDTKKAPPTGEEKGSKKAGKSTPEVPEDPKSEKPDENTQGKDTKEEVTDQQLLDLLKFSRISQKQQSKDHKFWNTQPVPQFEEEKEVQPGPIEVKTVDQVRKEPYELSPGYVWAPINMDDPATVDDVYNLLTENYVEDDDNMFRFDYSRNFLAWALKPPGYYPDWHVGVRAKSTAGKLVGFITGIPVSVRVANDVVRMAEINFLCVHKRLRTKRLAPVLIKEVTRRVNLRGIWQAVYTAGVVLPRPIAKNRYWHRSLNPKKLVEVGFSRLPPRMTYSRLIKLYKLPETTKTPGLRALTKKDCGRAMRLLMAHLSRFQLTQVFDTHELEHWLLPRDDVVYAYVVEDPSTHEVTDVVSFYSLPSSIIGNDKYSTLRAAYSFYNVATKTPWLQLMHDALVLARNAGFDVFNALNVMDNEQVFKELKFGIGDGNLQYYLYNWRHPELQPHQVGMVLL